MKRYKKSNHSICLTELILIEKKEKKITIWATLKIHSRLVFIFFFPSSLLSSLPPFFFPLPSFPPFLHSSFPSFLFLPFLKSCQWPKFRSAVRQSKKSIYYGWLLLWENNVTRSPTLQDRAKYCLFNRLLQTSLSEKGHNPILKTL